MKGKRLLQSKKKQKNMLTIIQTAYAVFLAIVGFILSPLSWWNDLAINVPLAYIMAWPIGYLISLFAPVPYIAFLGLFVLMYWITNIIGFLMIHYGLLVYKKQRITKKEIRGTVILTTAYSVLVILLIQISTTSSLLQQYNLLPPWVS